MKFHKARMEAEIFNRPCRVVIIAADYGFVRFSLPYITTVYRVVIIGGRQNARDISVTDCPLASNISVVIQQ